MMIGTTVACVSLVLAIASPETRGKQLVPDLSRGLITQCG